MRALLVVNTQATGTTPRSRDVLARALASDLKLDVAETERPRHATELARQAAAEGLDLVVTLGGDGTVNEVVNGLAGSDTALACVPGGGANVFARALGLPNSPVEATGEILDAIRVGRRRSIGLGMADSRYFTVNAGLGLDAAVVRAVERHRRKGRVATPRRYVRSAVWQFYAHTDRRHPAVTLRVPGEQPVSGLFLGIAANGSPWTYLGDRPVNPCPEADFDRGLDFAGLTRMATPTMLRVLRQMLAGRPRIKSRHAVRRQDLAEFTLHAERPLPAQVDGDYVGEVRSLHLRSVPESLTVIV